MVEVYWLEITPLTWSDVSGLVELGEEDIVLPGSPYYDYPFRPASNIIEWYFCVKSYDGELCRRYKGRSYASLDREAEELAELLGMRYAVIVDEGDDATVILTNRGELVSLLDKLESRIRAIQDELERSGADPYDGRAIMDRLYSSGV